MYQSDRYDNVQSCKMNEFHSKTSFIDMGKVCGCRSTWTRCAPELQVVIPFPTLAPSKIECGSHL